MKLGTWKGCYWQKYSEDIVLAGDSVTQVCTFYEDIVSVCTMSHAKAAKVLPDYDTFSENKTIRDMTAPVKTSYYHQEAKAYLILISKSIYDLPCINNVVSPITCLKTAMHRSTCISQEMDLQCCITF